MKTLVMTGTVLSFIFLASTLLCGLWLRFKGSDPDGVRFHMMIAMVTVGIVAATLVANLVAQRTA